MNRYILALVLLAGCAGPSPGGGREQRLLYVASPGIRNYVEWGGKGILVYDIDADHRLVRRLPSPFDDRDGLVENVKGICASAATRRLYVSTIRRLASLDLLTGAVLWVKSYEGGCDRMAITPDGKWIYLPDLEKDRWHVVDAETGRVAKEIVTNQGSHNTVCPPLGRRVYMAGLRSPYLHVADPARHDVVLKVGPFGAPIRPFTVNGAETLCYVNVNGLIGFEVGDLRTGKALHRVEVPGVSQGPIKRHGCPSHGVGLTPDEREVWVVDAFNQAVHLFDATATPPRFLESLKLEIDQPGWITFTIRGDYAYPSTGEVFEVRSRRKVAQLADERGRPVQSEKMLEVDLLDGSPLRVGDQFGVGRVTAP